MSQPFQEVERMKLGDPFNTYFHTTNSDQCEYTSCKLKTADCVSDYDHLHSKEPNESKTIEMLDRKPYTLEAVVRNPKGYKAEFCVECSNAY